MYTKLIDPKIHGQKAYDNKGSSAQTANYLKQEASKDGKEAVFFGADKDNLSAVEVTQNIDNNVKGLRAADDKFYSLVLSPSEAELAFIGNDEKKLKAYTREVMEHYASNFNLKDGRKLDSENLVWAATIHQDRHYRGTDPEVSGGTAKAGEKRPGLQTHIHIIVSARDDEQKITLNPAGRRDRFNLVEWQQRAGQQFERQFGYTAQVREKVRQRERDASRDAGRAARIGERVEGINQLVPKEQALDPQRVQKIAADREYDKSFYRMLNRVESRAKQGLPIDNAYHLLATGRERPQQQQGATATLRALQQAVRSGSRRDERTENISQKKGRNSAELDIEM